MFTFLAWVSKFASVTEIIKYVEKLLIFAFLVFCRTFCQTVYKFQTSCFDELSFFPITWKAVLSQLWRRSIFKFCGYKLAEAARFLKFKSEFIIIGRGCLVLLKFKFKLCKDYVPLVLRGSLPKSGPLDFATKNTFPLFFVGEEALVSIY